MRLVLAITTVILAVSPVFRTAAAETDARTVQVNGSGEVHAEPDRAVITMGVESRKPQLETARADVARGIDALLKLTREMKIDAKDVRTTRLTVQPEYDWNSSTKERRLVGYYVARQAEIVVRDLEQLGLLLERGVTLGANTVGDARLESSKRREFEREALALAVDDARLNAEMVARAAKASLGSVRTIDSSVSYAPIPIGAPQVMSMRATSADANSAATYQAGQLTFSASVRVQYDLVVKQ